MYAINFMYSKAYCEYTVRHVPVIVMEINHMSRMDKIKNMNGIQER